MDEITYPIGSIVSGAQKIRNIFSDFKPELERIEIDYAVSEATLYFGVTVPDKYLTRKQSAITLERPVGFTLEAIRGKNFLSEVEITETSDSKYKISAEDLDTTEEYQLIISGRVSQDIIDDIISRDCYSKRKTREKYQKNIVYNVGAVTWDDSEVVTVITRYLDSVQFDEYYLPRKVRQLLPNSVEDYQSDAWTTQFNQDYTTQDSRAKIESLPDPIQNLINTSENDSPWWFSAEVMGDYIEINGKINYRDVIFAKTDLPLPVTFDVETRTEFEEQQGLLEGTVEFEKEKFWKDTRNEFTEMN